MTTAPACSVVERRTPADSATSAGRLRILTLLALLCTAGTAWSEYDPYRHGRDASWAMIAGSGVAMACAVPMLASRDSTVRRAARSMLLWGAIDAALGGLDLVTNESERRDGVSTRARTQDLRMSIRVDWLVDYVLFVAGVVILQTARSPKARVRGWRWVSRGAVHLIYDSVNYGITFR